MHTAFPNRVVAGRRLAEKLAGYFGRENTIVLGLPRGGVPVAFEVSQRLQLPMDVYVVRKLGVPGYEELAMGAIASGGVRVLNEEVVQVLSNAGTLIEAATTRELKELHRREQRYRNGRPAPRLKGQTVILVDDGLATGATMRAAIAALRQQSVGEIVAAVPVGASATCADLQKSVDEFVCVLTPVWFRAVGEFYEDFSATTDEEVRDFLAAAAASHEVVTQP